MRLSKFRVPVVVARLTLLVGTTAPIILGFFTPATANPNWIDMDPRLGKDPYKEHMRVMKNYTIRTYNNAANNRFGRTILRYNIPPAQWLQRSGNRLERSVRRGWNRNTRYCQLGTVNAELQVPRSTFKVNAAIDCRHP